VAYLQTVRRRFVVWNSRREPRENLRSTKTRVDQAPLYAGTGIHPPPPGALAIAARVGTQGAPVGESLLRRSTLNCPASLIGNGSARSALPLAVPLPRIVRQRWRIASPQGRRCAARRHCIDLVSRPCSTRGGTLREKRVLSRVNVAPVRPKSMPTHRVLTRRGRGVWRRGPRVHCPFAHPTRTEARHALRDAPASSRDSAAPTVAGTIGPASSLRAPGTHRCPSHRGNGDGADGGEAKRPDGRRARAVSSRGAPPARRGTCGASPVAGPATSTIG